MYSRNMVDYHLIMDLIPAISRLYFLNQLGDLSLSAAQSVGHLGLHGGTMGVGQWSWPIDECLEVALCL